MLAIFLLISIIFAFFSDQPILMYTSVMSLYFNYALFWKDGEPKIIFFALFMFNISITIKVFYAAIIGVPYESLSYNPNIIFTTYIALLAYFIYGTGIYIFTINIRNKIKFNFSIPVYTNFNNIQYLYIAAVFIKSVLSGIMFVFAGLSQIINGIVTIELGFIFLLIYPSFFSPKNNKTIIVILLIDVILNLFSFFSNFKDILFTAGLVLVAPKLKLTLKSLGSYFVLISVTLYLLFVWQSVKEEYRTFLNGGSKSQSVQVSQEDALKKLGELAVEDSKKKNTGNVYESIDRLSYIDFFAESMRKVPDIVPFENGTIWKNNIIHILVPRYFYPEKEEIDDSKMINKYCLRKVKTAKDGVSFSLGFIAESYIDFGIFYMFIPIFLLGCFQGIVYTQVLQSSINTIWGYVLAVPLWTYMNCNGTPGAKILGWLIMYYIAVMLFNKFLVKRLDKFLRLP